MGGLVLGIVVWQGLVILTVVIAYAAKGRRAAFFAALFWTVWTLIVVFMLPLVIVQLISAWAAFFVCDALARFGSRNESHSEGYESGTDWKKCRDRLAEQQAADARYASLRALAERTLGHSDLPIWQQVTLEAAQREPGARLEIIEWNRHMDVFCEALEGSKINVVICAPMFDGILLDMSIQGRIRAALDRGVALQIFGLVKRESLGGDDRQDCSAWGFLSSLQSVYGKEKLYLADECDYGASVICDDRFLVLGMDTWLSHPRRLIGLRSARIWSEGLVQRTRSNGDLIRSLCDFSF